MVKTSDLSFAIQCAGQEQKSTQAVKRVICYQNVYRKTAHTKVSSIILTRNELEGIPESLASQGVGDFTIGKLKLKDREEIL